MSTLLYSSSNPAEPTTAPLPMDLEDAIENGEDLLTEVSERSFRMILLGASLGASMRKRQENSQLKNLAA